MIFVIILASACDMLAFSPQTHVSVVFQRSGIPWPHHQAAAAVGTLLRPGGVSIRVLLEARPANCTFNHIRVSQRPVRDPKLNARLMMADSNRLFGREPSPSQ